MTLDMRGPSFKEMRNQELYTDAVVKSGTGRQWKIHKVVMSRLGRFLCTAFSHPDFGGTLDLAVSDEVVQVIIDMAYEGLCIVSVETVLEVLEAALMYQLESLIEKCICFIHEKMISPDNVMAVKMFMKVHKEELEICTDGTLNHIVDKYIRRNFSDIYEKEEVYELSSEELEVYFKEDDLNISEDDLLDFVVNYIAVQSLGKDEATRLLANVRLSLVHTSKLSNISDETRILFLENERNFEDCHPRYPRDITMIFNCLHDDDNLWTNITGQVFNGRKNEWKVLEVGGIIKNLSRQTYPEFVIVGNILYVLQMNFNVEKKIQMTAIDIRSGSSLGMKEFDFPHDEAVFDAIAWNGGILVTMMKIAAFYDPVQKRWSSFPAPQIVGEQSTLVVVKGNLFAIGGFSDDERIAYNNIGYYDTENKSWNLCGVMKNITGYNVATVVHGKVFVFPRGETNIVYEGECFQPIFEIGRMHLNWLPTIKMPWEEERDFQVSTIDNKILFVELDSKECHIYNPRNGEWSPAADKLDVGDIPQPVSILNNWEIGVSRIEELCNGNILNL